MKGRGGVRDQGVWSAKMDMGYLDEWHWEGRGSGWPGGDDKEKRE